MTNNKNPEPSNRQLLIIILLFSSLIISGLALINWSFDKLIVLIPHRWEQKLGSVIVPIYEKQAENSLVQESLNKLLDKLENNLSEQSDRDYKILYLPEDTVNALAIPGDTIIIYQGLLAEVESENELMMILAHELGHFANRDHLRSLGKMLLLRSAIAYFLGDFGSLQIAAETIGNAQYSQYQELKADEFGLDLLNKNYGHVAGATDFFIRLNKNQQINISFLATHPNPEKRIKNLEKLITNNNYSLKNKKPLSKNILIENK